MKIRNEKGLVTAGENKLSEENGQRTSNIGMLREHFQELLSQNKDLVKKAATSERARTDYQQKVDEKFTALDEKHKGNRGTGRTAIFETSLGNQLGAMCNRKKARSRNRGGVERT